MKILTKFALLGVILTTAFAAQADPLGGYYRSSGYVYRNPYAAYPSIGVRGYYRSSGAYVMPYYRTAPNRTVTDNLSYRGYGTIRLPR